MKTIIIYQFMIKDLKLSGIELLLYALVYGFSSHGSSCFLNERGYCNSLGCSRSQFFRAKSSLFQKNLLISSDSGLMCNTADFYAPDLSDRLDEMIRIAKTPWLDV